MNSRVEEAAERHKKGYNCAQAVACTYCDLFGLEEKTAFRASEGFGSGMGAMAGTCGAVAGAVFLAGLKRSTAHLEKPDSKAKTYQLTKEITEKFLEKNHSLVCREIKGQNPTGAPYRGCRDCVRDAAGLVEEVLLEKE